MSVTGRNKRADEMRDKFDAARAQTYAMGFVVDGAVIWGMLRAINVALKQSEQGLAVHNDIIRRNERETAGFKATFITRDSVRAAIVTAGIIIGIWVGLRTAGVLG